MPLLPTIYDRPSIAAANLLSGNFSAAGRALFSPGVLPPANLQTLGQKVVPEESGGILKSIAETLTHPAFILGAFLSLRFPIARAAEMFKFRRDLVGWRKRLGPVMSRISSIRTQFANTPLAGTAAAGFRGAKDLPDLIENAALETGAFAEKHTKKMVQALTEFHGAMGRDPNPLEQARIGAYMDGLWHEKQGRLFGAPVPLMKASLVTDMGAEERKFADALRGTYKGMWEEVYGGLPQKKQQQIVDALRKRGWHGDPTEVEHYFPHMVRMTNEDYERILSGMIGGASGREAIAGQEMLAASKFKVSSFMAGRFGQMLPETEDLKLLNKYVNPAALNHIHQKLAKNKNQLLEQAARFEDKNFQSGVRTILEASGASKDAALRSSQEIADIMSYGGKQAALDELGTLLDPASAVSVYKQYPLRVLPVTERYVRSVSNQYTWMTLGYGEKINVAAEHLDDLGRHMLQDTYVPQLMGRATFRQSIQSMEWAQTRDKWIRGLRDPQGLGKFVPKGARQWLEGKLLSHSGPMTLGGFAGSVAGYLYTTTLGLNPSSAARNLLQTTITTGPLIGWKNTLKGMNETRDRVGRYFTLRHVDKLAADVAFDKAFPEFVSARMDPSPIADKLFKDAVEEAYTKSAATTPGSGKKALAVIKDKMLAMFTATERFNRLSAFYGGRHKAITEGLSRTLDATGLSEVDRYARRVVEFTQFPAGVGQTPYILSNLTPPLRQFLHFPMRYMEFLAGSTMMGVPGRRNWGTIGRAMMATTTAYEVGRNALDVDLSPGLMWGALPMPMDKDSPFYPLPVVPPVVSIAGSAAMAIHQGSLDPLKRAAPLLVPGGVALNRLRRVLPPFADYEHRLPDGRVPLKTEKGTLIGYLTPGQLARKALGLPNMTLDQERQLMEYLMAQRDELRQYRKDYLDAAVGNDFRKTQDIQAQFQQQFPGFKKIPFTSQELNAVRLRMRVTRLERVLDTLPKEYRAEYGKIVAQALGVEAEQLMGVDPMFLMRPGVSLAKRPRQGTGGSATTGFPGVSNGSPLGSPHPGIGFGIPYPTIQVGGM